jgi:leucyl-tRNA synthetase
MSKSKKNTIGPEEITATFGADTARWFMLSDSPPERDVEWTDRGAEGAHRFVQRIWRLVQAGSALAGTGNPARASGNAAAARRAAHKALKAVGADFERLGFNKAIAHVHQMVNEIAPVVEDRPSSLDDRAAIAEVLGFLVQMIAPVMPHLAEECWAVLGNTGMISAATWPKYDPLLVVDDEIDLPVQVNGRKRADIRVAVDAANEVVTATALAHEAIIRVLGGAKPKKVIVVPKRIVNIVV